MHLERFICHGLKTTIAATLLTIAICPSLQAQNMRECVHYLASDELGGRFPATHGDTLAAKYIAKTFENIGLTPFEGQYLHPFTIRDTLHCLNVVAVLEGSSRTLRHEVIVVGAHFDHLGYGGVGSGSRRPDTTAVHPGADDNASGVAMVLELARRLAANPPQRTVVFAAFGAEEQGLGGSKALAANVALCDRTVLMLNFDMVGSLRNHALSIGGSGTFAHADSLLNNIASQHGLSLALSPQGYGPSDHTSFYAKNRPVLFITTGGTLVYHTPADRPELINFGGMDTIAHFASALITTMANAPQKPVFQEAGPADNSFSRTKLRVKLGIMPDHVGSHAGGLRADIVVPNKPAHKAGMKTGDLILSINGIKISNIEEYMQCLSTLSPEHEVRVIVLRNGQELNLTLIP